MTGSAFARCELRGTFHVLLRRALSGIEGEFEGENVAGLSLDWAVGGFFFCWVSIGFIRFFGPRGLPSCTPNMDLSWTSFWEASWNDFGMVFGGKDAPKKAQDDAKTAMMTSFLGSIF